MREAEGNLCAKELQLKVHELERHWQVRFLLVLELFRCDCGLKMLSFFVLLTMCAMFIIK